MHATTTRLETIAECQGCYRSFGSTELELNGNDLCDRCADERTMRTGAFAGLACCNDCGLRECACDDGVRVCAACDGDAEECGCEEARREATESLRRTLRTAYVARLSMARREALIAMDYATDARLQARIAATGPWEVVCGGLNVSHIVEMVQACGAIDTLASRVYRGTFAQHKRASSRKTSNRKAA